MSLFGFGIFRYCNSCDPALCTHRAYAAALKSSVRKGFHGSGARSDLVGRVFRVGIRARGVGFLKFHCIRAFAVLLLFSGAAALDCAGRFAAEAAALNCASYSGAGAAALHCAGLLGGVGSESFICVRPPGRGAAPEPRGRPGNWQAEVFQWGWQVSTCRPGTRQCNGQWWCKWRPSWTERSGAGGAASRSYSTGSGG